MRHKMFGGIHPAARKESTRRKALARMEKEPEWVILPQAAELVAAQIVREKE